MTIVLAIQVWVHRLILLSVVGNTSSLNSSSDKPSSTLYFCGIIDTAFPQFLAFWNVWHLSGLSTGVMYFPFKRLLSLFRGFFSIIFRSNVAHATNLAQSKLWPAELSREPEFGLRGTESFWALTGFLQPFIAEREKMSFGEQDCNHSALKQALCILLFLPYHRRGPADRLICMPKVLVRVSLVLLQARQDSR